MRIFHCLSAFYFSACTSSGGYLKTVDHVDIQKFMGDWYVLGGRFTFLESGVHNALESYTWNPKEDRIEIAFTYNKGALDGPIKSIPQKGWVQEGGSGARWKVSPLWPLKFDYLIVDLADDYSWTAIGVPDQKYLWIMARDWKNPDPVVAEAVRRLNAKGYRTTDLVLVPQQWPRTPK
jgi:apolipoprotein D and lipocalin family protein